MWFAGGHWTGLINLRIGKSGGLFRKNYWKYEVHKMRGISWLAEELSASVELTSYIYIYEVNGNLYVAIHIAQWSKYIK